MSVSAKTKSERVAEKEEAILTAASAIFLDKGMQAAKMAEIARRADVAEGTLYLYFKNKEALFSGVVARHWQDLTKGAGAAVEAHEEPRQQLSALASFTLRRILEDWQLFELSFYLHYSPSAAADVSDRKGYVKIFDRVIRRGIDRGEFAPQVPVRQLRDLFFGTMEYAARSMREKRTDGDEAEALHMLSLAMDGVLGSGVPAQDRVHLADRLEAAVERLEALALSPASDT